MKSLIKYISFATILTFIGCREHNLDSINPVAQGTDSTAPAVSIISPSSDIALPASMSKTDMTFSFKVSDDIEIGKVVISLDGTAINTYNSFVDYRIFAGNYLYKGLSLGTHTFKVDATDLTGKTTSKSFTFTVSKYNPILSSESLYVPFNSGNDFKDLVSLTQATITGSPTTAPGKKGVGYQGVSGAYISYPISGLFGNSNTELSFSFWYKVDASQERAGLVVVGKDDNRTQGFRLFREGTTGIKINCGLSNDESWNTNASLPDTTSWAFITVTISQAASNVYINGVLKSTATFSHAIDFSGCSSMQVGSGGPTFSYWGHTSDTSIIDEFKVYNKALTPAEVITEMNN